MVEPDINGMTGYRFWMRDGIFLGSCGSFLELCLSICNSDDNVKGTVNGRIMNYGIEHLVITNN